MRWLIILLIVICMVGSVWAKIGTDLSMNLGSGGATVGPPPSPGDVLLMETGDSLLLETGDKILLE